MPVVAGKHYAYTAKGKAKAARAATAKGVPVKRTAGSRVPSGSKRTY